MQTFEVRLEHPDVSDLSCECLIKFNSKRNNVVLELCHLRFVRQVFLPASLLVRRDDLLLLFFKLNDRSIELLAILLIIGDLLLHKMLALLSNQGLFHTVGNRALVQILERLFVHAHLVANAN